MFDDRQIQIFLDPLTRGSEGIADGDDGAIGTTVEKFCVDAT
jgi:hypothetical protein